jgi:serine/threonine-protein kinase
VLGTAAYLSPEQAAGRAATAASDRYAFAIVAFELLSGRKPFEGHVPAQMRQHAEAPPPRASMVAPELPPGVDPVLERGMAKDPAHRPPTASGFVDQLAAALRERRFAPTPAAATAATTPLRPRPAARRRATPLVLILAALALIAAAAIAALAGVGDQPVRRSTPAANAAPPRHRAPARRHATTTPTATTPTATAPAPADPVALNNQGYALLQRGQAAAALAPLNQAVQAFRAQARTGEIDYAYALYNLAEALRQSGRPAEAIPYYMERLQTSDFARGVVESALRAAQQAAGLAPAKGPGDGKGHGKHGGD